MVFGVGTWLKKKENDVLARNYEQIFGRHVILSTTRKGWRWHGEGQLHTECIKDREVCVDGWLTDLWPLCGGVVVGQCAGDGEIISVVLFWKLCDILGHVELRKWWSGQNKQFKLRSLRDHTKINLKCDLL